MTVFLYLVAALVWLYVGYTFTRWACDGLDHSSVKPARFYLATFAFTVGWLFILVGVAAVVAYNIAKGRISA